MGQVVVSIVSHGHGAMLPALLKDLRGCPEVSQVIVTRNIPESWAGGEAAENLLLIDNPAPRGFGANHNAAFRHVDMPYFAVLNPDVRLETNPFPILLDGIRSTGAALCAPAVVNASGDLEDSARYFPTVGRLTSKMLGMQDGRVVYNLGEQARPVPWVGGMFMLFPSEDFSAVKGFDEKFFLYYEDVDLCARLWLARRRVVLCPAASVVHNARRASRKNIRHMYWHIASMARYFAKAAVWTVQGRRPGKGVK